MNQIHYQPKRMNTINSYLMVEDVRELIEFTQNGFNAKLSFKPDRPNGQIMHAEILIGDSIIMAGEPMKDFGVFPCSLFLYVEDCGVTYKKAMSYGCKPIMEPAIMKHAGEKYGGILDKNGNIWWVATHIENVIPEEQAKRIEKMKENWGHS